MVDPELRSAALVAQGAMARFTPMTLDMLGERRKWIDSMIGPKHPSPPVTRHSITPSSGPGVVVYVINANPARTSPAILHLHGGGFTAGTASGMLPYLQRLAAELDCVVATVEYRLAPEAGFKEASEENYTALMWTHRHAEELGVDPSRIALLGESAGGCHAALLSVTARDRGEVPIRFQALIYPMLDDRTGSSFQVPEHIGSFGWNDSANRFGWECFLGQMAGLPEVPYRSVPARIEDLRGLPPAFLGVGSLDLFVEETVTYGLRLIQAGVPTELVVCPGAFHGFDTFAPEATVSRRFTAAKESALRAAFAPTAEREGSATPLTGGVSA
jgi:acetyl esterase/lipase